MKNVLYIGPYRQGDGWGKTSLSFLKALSTKNINLTSRPIWLNSDAVYYDVPEVEQYELDVYDKYDILIQYSLPNKSVYNADFGTNILVTTIDCRIDDTGWLQNIGLFDKIVVFSELEKRFLQNAGLSNHIIAFKYPPLHVETELYNINIDIDGLKLYCTKDISERSGLDELLKAYFHTFTANDDVMLLIPTDDTKKIQEYIQLVKTRMGMYNNLNMYPRIGHINSKQQSVINTLHRQCDVYIDVSYDLKLNNNIMNAVINNSIPVVLDTCTVGKKVSSIERFTSYLQRPLSHMYSGRYVTRAPCELSLADQLKKLYEEYKKDKLQTAKQEYQEIARDFIPALSNDIEEVLCT